MRPAERLIRAILRVSPARRRVWAARLFIASCVGWVSSHVVLVLLGESTFFNHTMFVISWWAILATAVDVIFTSDVRAEGGG